MVSASLLVVVLFLQRRLLPGPLIAIFVCGLFGTVALLSIGVLDKVIDRTMSGVKLIVSDTPMERKGLDDSYSGRMKMIGERFHMVLKKNPVFGFGFVHEDIVQNKLKPHIRYGSVIQTKKYKAMYAYKRGYVLALHSADVGWPTIIIDTGIVGLIIYLVFVASFFINFIKTSVTDYGPSGYLRTAFAIEFFTLLLLMFNGTTCVRLVQIPCFMLAGFAYCSKFGKVNGGEVKFERLQHS
jgi:hypothetical protein